MQDRRCTWGETTPIGDTQLKALQATLSGYALALHHHAIGADDLAVLAGLENFLCRKTGADNFTGIDQNSREPKGPHEAWEMFWRYLDEFSARKD